MEFTHFDDKGNAHMVDVSGKQETRRVATAVGTIRISPQLLEAVEGKKIKKGDVLAVAQVAGILGLKHTSDLIPLCHSLPLSNAEILFHIERELPAIHCSCTVKTEGKTGVEMEALTGVQIALLTIYDMCKAIDKRMVMTDIHLLRKEGGKSGDFQF